jgi:hypothetical protein
MNPERFVNPEQCFTVIQTSRDPTCLPQAGTSDIRLKLKITGKDPTEKGMRTLKGLIPYLK